MIFCRISSIKMHTDTVQIYKIYLENVPAKKLIDKHQIENVFHIMNIFFKGKLHDYL